MSEADVLLAGAGDLGGARVADLGCGRGRLLPALAGAVGADGEVVALDHQAAVLGEATYAVPRALRPRVRFVCRDIRDTGLRDGEADVAHMAYVLVHVPGPANAMAELARVLRPGGLACITDLDLTAGEDEPDEATRLRAATISAWKGSGRSPDAAHHLASLADAAGLDVEQEATAGRDGTGVLLRFARGARKQILRDGLLPAAEFSRLFATCEALASSGSWRIRLPTRTVWCRR